MADNGGGTSVTLIVEQGIVPPTVGVPQTPPARPHLPFTGFDLTTALVLAVLLLALGSVVLLLARRPTHRTTELVSRRTS